MKRYCSILFFVILNSLSQNLLGQLYASYSNTPAKGCPPLNVHFTNTSTGKHVKYLWDFGNGNTSILKNPKALFTLAGTYNVTLTIWDASNKKSILTKQAVTVFKPPSANATISKKNVCLGDKVTFTDNSTPGDGKLTKWKWDLGDGNVKKGKIIPHTYSRAKTYTLKQIVTDINGCKHTQIYKNYITVHAKPNARFNIDKTFSCNAPFTVKLNSLNTVSSYQWNLGDGQSKSGKSINHTYNNYGKYTITFTAKNKFGCKSTATNIVTVEKMNVGFTAIKRVVCLGEKTFFLNKTTPNVKGNRFVWDFGDNNQSNYTNPSHEYTKPGFYTVSLKVSNGNCKNTKSVKQFIEVSKPPIAIIKVSDSVACDINNSFVFTDGSKVQNSKRKWDMGRGQKHNYASFKQKYKTPGLKLATLTVTNKSGCKHTAYKTIKIGNLHANYNQKIKDYVTTTIVDDKKKIYKYGGCKPLKLIFENASYSTFKITSVKWETKQGFKKTGNKFELYYKDTGEDIGKIMVEDELGCKDTLPFLIEIGLKTKPWFKINKKTICPKDSVKFINLTPEPPVVDEWSWSFGSSEKNPIEPIDQDTGYLDITLTAIINGCRSDTTRRILYVNPPKAIISTNSTGCNLDTIKLINNSKGADSFVWHYSKDTSFTTWKESHDTLLKFWPKDLDKLYFRLYTWNFRTQCTDSAVNTIEASFVNFDVHWPKAQKCAPISRFFKMEGNRLNEHKWTINNNEIFESDTLTYLFKKAGKYTITASASAGDCLYERSKTYTIPGIELNANVSQKGVCLPVKITLNDSLYEPNSTFIRYWEIGSRIYNHSSKTSVFNLREAPSGKDTSIKAKLVYLDTVSNCKSELSFNIPVRGPQIDISEKIFFHCKDINMQFMIKKELGDIANSPLWKFSDGTSSTMSSPALKTTYNKPLEVELETTDAEGCKAVRYKTYNFSNKGLFAKFKADTSGRFCPPLTVNFKDISTQGTTSIVKWEWTFGDGTSSILKNPSKIYLIPGKYTVSLTVTDRRKCSHTTTIPDFILVKGPTGNYSFDKTKKCAPATVNFKSTTQRADTITWDLGDGTVVYGQNQTHVYTRPGRYIPLLILADTLGCNYILPRVDTIYIYANPKADFKIINPCLGDSIRFKNLSTSKDGTLKKYNWDFNDGNLSIDKHPIHFFKNGKNHLVKLEAISKHNCKDTSEKSLRLFDIKANFNLIQKDYCIDEKLRIKNTSYADTHIIKHTWDIDNNTILNTKEINPNLIKRGKFKLQLIVEDAIGCKDTMLVPKAYFVGDTLPPKSPFIYRVNVLNDNAVDIKFAESKIPDFKRYEVFRKNNIGNYTKILQSIDQKDTLKKDGSINTLHQSHCYKVRTENSCSKKLPIDELKEHCTVEVTASTGLNHVKLDWNHYVGWDSIKYYDIYREDLKIKGKFDSIAHVLGNTNHYVDTTIFCDQILYYKILAKQKKHIFPQESFSDTSGAKPIYINTVPPNEIWRVSVEQDTFVHIEWVPTRKSRFPIVYYKIHREIPQTIYKPLKETLKSDTTKYNNRKVEVDITDYNYKMYGVDQCGDRSEFSNVSKTILLKTSINKYELPVLNWTKYKGWKQGIEKYLIEFKNTDGTFSKIGETKPTVQTFTHKDVPMNCMPNYCYRITAIRNQPSNYPDSSYTVISHSNESCAPVVSKLYVPNAFTVNKDNLNETFLVKGIYIKNYSIKIFNRWGEIVYSNDDCSKPPWDGTYNGIPAQQDVYIYLIQAIGADGKTHNFKGNVTLLK